MGEWGEVTNRHYWGFFGWLFLSSGGWVKTKTQAMEPCRQTRSTLHPSGLYFIPTYDIYSSALRLRSVHVIHDCRILHRERKQRTRRESYVQKGTNNTNKRRGEKHYHSLPQCRLSVLTLILNPNVSHIWGENGNLTQLTQPASLTSSQITLVDNTISLWPRMLLISNSERQIRTTSPVKAGCDTASG